MAEYMSEESGSDEEDIKEHEAEAAAELKSGKLKVPIGDGTFRCPFCVSKKKQAFKYHELHAHAKGQGKSKRGNFVMGGQHRALQAYLENELKEFAQPAAPRIVRLEQAPPQRNQTENMIVHPWVALLYNIEVVEAGGKRTCPGSGELKDRFREYSPDQIRSFWDYRGALGIAAITFRRDMQGYDDCRAFERSFLSDHHGKNNWLKNKEGRCLGTGLYGWMATAEDYNERGKVGEFLRDKFNLKTMIQLEDDKMRTHEHLRKQLQETIDKQSEKLENADTENFGLRNRMEEAEQARKRAELERQIVEERYRRDLEDVKAESQRMQEMHQLEMKQRAVELELEMQSLQERHKQLNIKESDNEAESKRLELERLENERRIDQISKEMDLRNKQHNSNISMHEKHENQNQDLAKEIQEKKMSLAKQQKKEVERQQLQAKIEAEKLKEANAEQSSETIKRLEEQLKELEEEKEDALDTVNQIAMMHRSANDIVTAGKKAAVQVLDDHGSETAVGNRRMGEINEEGWAAACRERFKSGDWQFQKSKLASFWGAQIKKHDWFPYKKVPTKENKDKFVEVVNEDDPKLKKLKEKFGETIYNSVATALLEIQQYNASGRYPVPTPWNHAANQEASLAETITYLGKLLDQEKQATKEWQKEKKGLEKEVKSLKAALDANATSEDGPETTTGRGRGKRKKLL